MIQGKHDRAIQQEQDKDARRPLQRVCRVEVPGPGLIDGGGRAGSGRMVDPLQIGPKRPQSESGAMALIDTEPKIFGELVAVLDEIARRL